MEQQNKNIILYSIDLNQSKQPSQAVQYSEEYAYLKKSRPGQPHLLVQKIALSPSPKKYSLHFYELQQVEGNAHSLTGNVPQRKIATMSINQDEAQQKILRLPGTSHNIGVETNAEHILRGVLKRGQEKQSLVTALFDPEGVQQASLLYQLKHVTPVSEQSQSVLLESRTLNSRDFERNKSEVSESDPNRQLANIDEELKHTLEQISEEDFKQDRVNNTEYILPRKRRKQCDSRNSQRGSQIAGREQEEAQPIQTRVSSFRTPIASKAPFTRPIDLSSLRKCQLQLGLQEVDIQNMLIRNQEPRVPFQEKEGMSMSSYLNQDATIRLGKAEKKTYKQCAVETYTPLPSIKSSIEHTSKNFRSRSIKHGSIRDSSPESASQVNSNRYAVNYSQASQELSSRVDQVNSRNKLHLQKKVVEVRVGRPLNKSREVLPIPITQMANKKRKNRQKRWQSCKDTPAVVPSCPQSSLDKESGLYPEYTLIINNISLHLQKQVQGSKYLELSLSEVTFNTEALPGSNLIWSSKSFAFDHVTPNEQITLSAMTQGQNLLLGKIRMGLAELLLNKKQSYYQSLILSDKQVLGTIVIGYEIKSHKSIIKKYQFPRQSIQLTHSHTELKGKNSFPQPMHNQRDSSMEVVEYQHKLPSPKQNPITAKKYRGGANIKIGKAHRFDRQQDIHPGPGNYELESEFSRHAFKQL